MFSLKCSHKGRDITSYFWKQASRWFSALISFVRVGQNHPGIVGGGLTPTVDVVSESSTHWKDLWKYLKFAVAFYLKCCFMQGYFDPILKRWQAESLKPASLKPYLLFLMTLHWDTAIFEDYSKVIVLTLTRWQSTFINLGQFNFEACYFQERFVRKMMIFVANLIWGTFLFWTLISSR